MKVGKPISDRQGLSEMTLNGDMKLQEERTRHGKTGEECSGKTISKYKDPELGESDWCVLGNGR